MLTAPLAPFGRGVGGEGRYAQGQTKIPILKLHIHFS